MWKPMILAGTLALGAAVSAMATPLPYLSSDAIWADFEPVSDIMMMEGDVHLTGGADAQLVFFGGLLSPGGVLSIEAPDGSVLYEATLSTAVTEPDGLHLEFAAPEDAVTGPSRLSLWLELDGADLGDGFAVQTARLTGTSGTAPIPLPAGALLLAGGLLALRLTRPRNSNTL